MVFQAEKLKRVFYYFQVQRTMILVTKFLIQTYDADVNLRQEVKYFHINLFFFCVCYDLWFLVRKAPRRFYVI